MHKVLKVSKVQEPMNLYSQYLSKVLEVSKVQLP